jgi:hypothetical protein
MLAGEMMTWWLSGGADAQGQSTPQLPCPLFFFFLFQAPTQDTHTFWFFFGLDQAHGHVVGA